MTSTDSRVKGKVALVTGSSSGAGAEIAREFGRVGAHVAVHCRSNLEAAQEVAAAIRRAGHSVTAFCADLGIAAQARHLAVEVAAQLGMVTILVTMWVHSSERPFSNCRSMSGMRCWLRT